MGACWHCFFNCGLTCLLFGSLHLVVSSLRFDINHSLTLHFPAFPSSLNLFCFLSSWRPPFRFLILLNSHSSIFLIHFLASAFGFLSFSVLVFFCSFPPASLSSLCLPRSYKVRLFIFASILFYLLLLTWTAFPFYWSPNYIHCHCYLGFALGFVIHSSFYAFIVGFAARHIILCGLF